MNKSSKSLFLCLCAILLCTMPLFAGESLWTFKGKQLKWHRVLSTGNVLAGGDAGLYCIDAQSGKPAWQREDIQGASAYQVDEIEGTPYLLVSKNNFGGSTRLWAIDVQTGKTLWETEKLKGATIGVFAHPLEDRVLLLTSASQGQGKTNPDLIYFNLADGNVLWEMKFPEKVDLHQAEQRSRWSAHFDLSGHQPPVFDGDSIYFTYAGLHRVEAATGKVLWGLPYDVTEGRLKRGNSQAVIDGDTIYSSAKGQLRAVDKQTGKQKWISADFGAAVAEVDIKGDMLYGRMGGTFFDDKKQDWDLKKPLGVVALDRNSGQVKWKFDKMSDAITNLLLTPSGNTIVVADKDELVGLNVTNGAEQFREKVDFKNKSTGGEKAMKVARFGMGGLRSGLKGLSDDKKGDDVPVNIALMPNGIAVVRGRQHVLGFNAESHAVMFANTYNPPGFAGWQKFAMISAYATAYAINTSGARSTSLGSSSNNQFNNMRQGNISRMSATLSKRFSATKAAGQYVYMLTQVEDGKDKGPGLVAVNLASGETDGQVSLRSKDPEYVVDEVTGNVFNLKDDEIEAYRIR